MKKNSKKEKNKKLGDRGITLIALIVTIIVLLILAGVSIAVLTGENGILNRATSAKQTHEEKTAEEELRLGISALTIDYRKNTTNALSFRDYVMENKQALANAMGVNANELTMDRENYSVTYKGQVYIVGENGGLEPFRLIALTGFNIKETAVEVQQGKTKQLTIENKTPNDANEQILWESSNTEVATVDANGVVRGIAAGSTTATITATTASGGATSSTSCVVTVTESTSEIPEGVTNRVTYGKYVNYNVNLGIGTDTTSVADDWKVFYDDGTNIYIIAADYVPNTNTTLQTAVSNMGATAYSTYGVYWPIGVFKTSQGENTFSEANGAADIFSANRPTGTAYLEGKGFLGYWKGQTTTSSNQNAQTTASLMDTKVWEGFAGGVSGAYAIGGPTLSMWIESWNAQYPSDKLYYNRASSTGYYVKAGGQPSTSDYSIDSSVMSGKTGYGNTLYYPHQSKVSDCSGYWLASPSANNLSYEMNVYCGGSVGFSSCTNGRSYGVRPVVCLPSNVTLTPDANNANLYNISAN